MNVMLIPELLQRKSREAVELAKMIVGNGAADDVVEDQAADLMCLSLKEMERLHERLIALLRTGRGNTRKKTL
jgi:hypothetical protein